MRCPLPQAGFCPRTFPSARVQRLRIVSKQQLVYLEEYLLHDKTSTSSNITAEIEISKSPQNTKSIFTSKLTKEKKRFGHC